MNITIILKSILLGIIEGLTEFIPVSSTAHLIIAAKIVDFSYISNNVFEIIIQLGAIMAICTFYHKKLISTACGFYKDKTSRDFTYNILLAFLPSVIFGVLFYSMIKTVFFSLEYIAFALIIGGIIIILVEKSKIKPKINNIDKLSKSKAISIGLFQVISMIPGVSRSGATIIGGLLLKLDRKTATEFSFFLAIPTIFAATTYDIYKNISILNIENFIIILIGFVSAFISSLFIIKWLLNFVSKNNFMIFAYYRIILGLIITYILYF
jgi:undecaprenyl-diphosphatase